MAPQTQKQKTTETNHAVVSFFLNAREGGLVCLPTGQALAYGPHPSSLAWDIPEKTHKNKQAKKSHTHTHARARTHARISHHTRAHTHNRPKATQDHTPRPPKSVQDHPKNSPRPPQERPRLPRRPQDAFKSFSRGS